MNLLKKLSNLLLGTHYHVDIEDHKPCKQKLMRNALREYGAQDYWSE